MGEPDAILTLVTLGVRDLKRSIAFYEAIGCKRKAKSAEGVGFFSAGLVTLAVYPLDSMAKDAGVAGDMPKSFRGVEMAWNCHSEKDVDAAVERAWQAGATVLKPPQKTFWGGYSAHFADPDGHLWEVAHNPAFPLSSDGRMQVPD
ncbi:MAG: VOC family protein [Pseudomonadota bacterium]